MDLLIINSRFVQMSCSKQPLVFTGMLAQTSPGHSPAYSIQIQGHSRGIYLKGRSTSNLDMI
jgi:hypothetical protein